MADDYWSRALTVYEDAWRQRSYGAHDSSQRHHRRRWRRRQWCRRQVTTATGDHGNRWHHQLEPAAAAATASRSESTPATDETRKEGHSFGAHLPSTTNRPHYGILVGEAIGQPVFKLPLFMADYRAKFGRSKSRLYQRKRASPKFDPGDPFPLAKVLSLSSRSRIPTGTFYYCFFCLSGYVPKITLV